MVGVMKKVVESAGRKVTSHARAKSAASALSQHPAGKALKKTDGIYSFVGIGVSKVEGGTSTKKHHTVK